MLIERGGDINVKDTKKSPLLAAVKKGDERILEWLRVKGGNLHIVFANDYHDNVVGNVSRGEWISGNGNNFLRRMQVISVS